MDEPIMLDTTDDIDFARLAALRGALRLELKGMKRRGRTAYSILKSDYGFKGNREKVLEQATQEIERRHNERQKGNKSN